MKYEADRALQVAVELERLGQTFYESLASGCGDTGIAALATRLAKDEERHIDIFKRMREALPDVHRGPLLTEEELFTASKELRDKILPTSAEVRGVALSRNLRKALDMAKGMENEAIKYYNGLALNTAGLDAKVLNEVAAEEKKHLKILQETANRLFPLTTNP